MTIRTSPSFEIKLAGPPSKDGEFVGYASTFGGPVDFHGDIISPGAFAKSLKEHAQNATMPAMLWHHDHLNPIGKWLELAEDAHGLKATGRLTLGTQLGADAYALLKDDVLALSIGFRAVTTLHRGDARFLTEIKLFEVSLVSMPANTRAKITVVKAKNRAGDVRTFEAQLREALGFSARQARRMAGPAWRALERRDDFDEAQAEHVAALLKGAAQSFNK